MAEVAARSRDSSLWPLVKKRWRAWLRAVHRDFGYLAIGFTVIYAVSGIAQNHIEDWGDVSYKAIERTVEITPVADDAPDDAAIAYIVKKAGLGTPVAKLRTGDEVRLEYANGSKATAIGSQLTIQGRERRAFIGAANWLHTARNKSGWKYVADVYAVLLLYLAISGIFMIKGKLGLKWRGAMLISAGVAVPIAAVMFSSPQPQNQSEPVLVEAAPAAAPTPTPALPAAPTPTVAPANEASAESEPPATETPAAGAGTPSKIDTSGIKFLPAE